MNAAGPAIPIGDTVPARENCCSSTLVMRNLFDRPGVYIPAFHGWSVG